MQFSKPEFTPLADHRPCQGTQISSSRVFYVRLDYWPCWALWLSFSKAPNRAPPMSEYNYRSYLPRSNGQIHAGSIWHWSHSFLEFSGHRQGQNTWQRYWSVFQQALCTTACWGNPPSPGWSLLKYQGSMGSENTGHPSIYQQWPF